MSQNLPEEGQIIVFDEVPAAGHCVRGTPYRVEVHGREFLFVSMAAGHASRDTAANVRASKWSEWVAPAPSGDEPEKPRLVSMAPGEPLPDSFEFKAD